MTAQKFSAPDSTSTETTVWLNSCAPAARGVVLLLHGLNVRPSKMDPLALVFQNLGFDVLRVALLGHRGAPDEIKHVSRQKWLDEIREAYALAKGRAAARPVYLVAFSLGAALAEDLMNLDASITFSRAVLFAPAILTRGTARLVKLLNLFGAEFVLLSRGPAEYRANPGTSVAAYNALFESIDSLDKAQYRKSNIPTLVFIDPADELVYAQGLPELFRSHALGAWKLIEVTNEAGHVQPKYHHLIIDESSVGNSQWTSICSQIRDHLE